MFVHHNLSLSFRKKRYATKYLFIVWKYSFLLHALNENKNIINAEYWVRSGKSQKLIPSKKTQPVLIANISSRKTQKIANISYMVGLKRVWILEARGLFLERSGNVSGPKANFPIKTC